MSSARYQLRCPECGHEFTYDNGYYDRNIARLGVEIQEITRQLAEHNKLPWQEKKARTDWWRRAKVSLAEKQKELSELKAIRKVGDQQVHRLMFDAFKRIVRERYGEKDFHEIIAQCEKELEAYNVSDLMKHDYTRAGYMSNVISISKL